MTSRTCGVTYGTPLLRCGVPVGRAPGVDADVVDLDVGVDADVGADDGEPDTVGATGGAGRGVASRSIPVVPPHATASAVTAANVTALTPPMRRRSWSTALLLSSSDPTAPPGQA